MKKNQRTSVLFVSFPVLLLAASGACTPKEGDIINYNQGGAGNEGPPGADGKDGKDGEDGKDGVDGRDGRDAMGGSTGKDGRDGRDGRDGKDGKDAESGGDGDHELPDEYPSNLPACETIVPLADLEIDLFGKDGHAFYFEVTPEMRVAQDQQSCKFGGGGAVYNLGETEVGCPTFAVNVRVVPSGSAVCADTGKVELSLPGQSSWRQWSEIPNFKLDVGEFQDQKFITGDKTVRMNNGQADSTIVREATALAIWRAMDYPAPKTRFVKTQSNVWDYDFKPGVFAAHVMVQPYKKAFFSQNLSQVTSAWEGEGDPFSGYDSLECEWSKDADCQDSVLKDIVKTVNNAPKGEGFMNATADVIDWPMLHQNQCLSALTGTGDDWIHNSNNVVIALRKDGKIMYLPYSTDISGGHPWYQNTPYDAYRNDYHYYENGGIDLPPQPDGDFIDIGVDGDGGIVIGDGDMGVGGQVGDGDGDGDGQNQGNLAQRCAMDPECRSQALDTCEEMIDQFEALDIVDNIVEERCGALTDSGLERGADQRVCDALADFYESRPDELRDELTMLRDQ